MNILAIGNSFSQDATRYLTQIAAARGVYFRTVNLYIGGCPLVRHYNNLLHDARAYSLEYGGETTGFYVSIRQALRARKWDVITLQQVSHKSPRYETYQPYLDVLAAECRRLCPDAKLFIHQTWAYEDGSKRLCEEMNIPDQNVANMMVPRLQRLRTINHGTSKMSAAGRCCGLSTCFCLFRPLF